MKKIGIFGGSFNPVHWGHIKPVLAAQEAFGLQQVIYVPAARPVHKAQEPLEDPYHRFAMVALSIGSLAGISLSTFELHRPGTYTVDTLRHFQSTLGGELYFLLGSDSLLQLPTWQQPEEILAIAKLIVLARPDFDLQELAGRLPEGIRAGIGNTILTFTHPKVRISGSQIRQDLVQGKAPRSALPTAVLKYIQRHQLYREA